MCLPITSPEEPHDPISRVRLKVPWVSHTTYSCLYYLCIYICPWVRGLRPSKSLTLLEVQNKKDGNDTLSNYVYFFIGCFEFFVTSTLCSLCEFTLKVYALCMSRNSNLRVFLRSNPLLSCPKKVYFTQFCPRFGIFRSYNMTPSIATVVTYVTSLPSCNGWRYIFNFITISRECLDCHICVKFLYILYPTWCQGVSAQILILFRTQGDRQWHLHKDGQ